MTEHDRGPLTPYEITWRSGYIETIKAHQALWPYDGPSFFGEQSRDPTPRVMLHGEVEGQWLLLLVADARDILSIRALPAAVAPEETPS
jgi:hypothetical protein